MHRTDIKFDRSVICMRKSSKHIEIVRSTTMRLSSMSQESCDAIVRVLTKHYAKVGVSVVSSLADLDSVVARNPDLVFLGMEYIFAKSLLGAQGTHKIWITDYLDDNHISY